MFANIKQDLESNDYNLDYPKLATVLILNQENFDKNPDLKRKGTDKDEERLKKMLSKVCPRSTIITKNDLKYNDIIDVVDDLKNGEYGDLKESASLMIFILTHGDNNGVLMCSNSCYNLNDFIQNFLPHNMPALAAKPKMFFVQACRGGKTDDGSNLKESKARDTPEGNDVSDARKSSINPIQFQYSANADILIGFSSYESKFPIYTNKMKLLI